MALILHVLSEESRKVTIRRDVKEIVNGRVVKTDQRFYRNIPCLPLSGTRSLKLIREMHGEYINRAIVFLFNRFTLRIGLGVKDDVQIDDYVLFQEVFGIGRSSSIQLQVKEVTHYPVVLSHTNALAVQ